MLNEEYAADVEMALERVETKIIAVLDEIAILERKVDQAGNPDNMTGRIRLYLRNNIATWIEDRGQIGSIPSLREELYEMATYDPEEIQRA